MSAHRFQTVESEPLTLDQIGIRRSDSSQIRPYSGGELGANLRRSLMLNLSNTSTAIIEDVVRGVSANLLRNYKRRHQRLSGAERGGHSNLRVVVSDTFIAELVENELDNDSTRVQLVLYALAIRGRHGWSAATDLLQWLQKRFVNLHQPLPAVISPPRSFQWSPPMTMHLPTTVLKKNKRASTPFRYEQFLKSIQYALDGRPGAEETAKMVAAFVLEGLRGQSVIHSTQLAIGVLNCLRQIDDIAYLRCAVVVKNLDSVTMIADETRELMLSPSPRLLFTQPDPKLVETGEPMVS